MSELPISKSGELKAGWPNPNYRHSNMEVGDINMDFVVGMTHTRSQHDSIWVIVDSLTKSAHFLPIKVTYSAEDYAKL